MKEMKKMKIEDDLYIEIDDYLRYFWKSTREKNLCTHRDLSKALHKGRETLRSIEVGKTKKIRISLLKNFMNHFQVKPSKYNFILKKYIYTKKNRDSIKIILTEDLSNTLKELREEEMLSIKALAYILNCPFSVVKNVECGVLQKIDMKIIDQWLFECQATKEVREKFML
jgi:ribosome-binding protein aMBF1 (putative translation factor)